MSNNTCSGCGQTKALEAFAFEASRQRYRTVCRECRNCKARERYANDEPKRAKAQERVAQRNQQIKSSPAMLHVARQQRREYKRIGRICAKPGYRPASHDAQVQCWRRWLKQASCRPVLHDAHVRCAKSDQRQWWHIHAKHQPGVATARRQRRQQARETLAVSYVTLLLTNGRTSCPISAGVPQALIELKQAHLSLVRHINQQQGETP